MNDEDMPEPMTEIVEAMVSMHQLFLDAMEAGFTEAQALALIANMIVLGNQ